MNRIDGQMKEFLGSLPKDGGSRAKSADGQEIGDHLAPQSQPQTQVSQTASSTAAAGATRDGQLHQTLARPDQTREAGTIDINGQGNIAEIKSAKPAEPTAAEALAKKVEEEPKSAAESTIAKLRASLCGFTRDDVGGLQTATKKRDPLKQILLFIICPPLPIIRSLFADKFTDAAKAKTDAALTLMTQAKTELQAELGRILTTEFAKSALEETDKTRSGSTREALSLAIREAFIERMQQKDSDTLSADGFVTELMSKKDGIIERAASKSITRFMERQESLAESAQRDSLNNGRIPLTGLYRLIERYSKAEKTNLPPSVVDQFAEAAAKPLEQIRLQANASFKKAHEEMESTGKKVVEEVALKAKKHVDEFVDVVREKGPSTMQTVFDGLASMLSMVDLASLLKGSSDKAKTNTAA